MVDVADGVDGIRGEAKVVHSAQQFVVVHHVEGGFKVIEGKVKILLGVGCVLYNVEEVGELAVRAFVGSEAFLGRAEDALVLRIAS